MRRAGFLAVIVALVCAATAAASGPGLKNLPIKVAVPNHGVRVYVFKLTVRLPPGTTISGGPPIAVHATNSPKLPHGTLAAAAVAKTGTTSWEIAVVVDSRKASGSGAATINANIEVPPPYSANPVTDVEESDPCKEYNRITSEITGADQAAAVAIWLLSGPTDRGREIELDEKGDCH